MVFTISVLERTVIGKTFVMFLMKSARDFFFKVHGVYNLYFICTDTEKTNIVI